MLTRYPTVSPLHVGMSDVTKKKEEAIGRASRKRYRFRLWEKKRGTRSTGSSWWGGAGESLFFAFLFVVGTFTLTELLVLLSRESRPDFLTSTWGLSLSVLILSSLVITGIVGTVYNVVLIGTSAERRAALAKRATSSDLLAEAQSTPKEFPCVPKDSNWKNSPGIRLAYRLPIESSWSWRLLVIASFCLVWNGAVAVLAVLALNQEGDLSLRQVFSPSWWTTFRLVVLVYTILGAALVYFLFNMLVAAAAIGPTNVEVSTLPFVPGESYSVFLTQAGHLSVNWLELRLVCEEEVSFTDGTDTRTEVEQVHDEMVFREEDFMIVDSQPFQKECRLDVPLSAMHSFLAEHNAVIWKLQVRAEAKNWPPFSRTFPLVVYPTDRNP